MKTTFHNNVQTSAGAGRQRKAYFLPSSLFAFLLILPVIAFPAGAQTVSASKQTGNAAPRKAGLPQAAARVAAAKPASAAALKSYSETLPDSVVKVDMIAIPAGTLTLAGKQVSVKPFWIASTETTWEAFDVFIASGPPSPAYDQTKYGADAIARPSKSYILPDLGWGHHGFPAINVSFLSSQMFCRWLSAKTGKKYRLPTEAEWEYACRAGSPAPANADAKQIAEYAWFADNSMERTHPVGKKQPNAWKLYDMLGNAGEWATDMEGKPVLCGPTFHDKADKITPTARARQTPEWQATDPQLPKSRWWLADGNFVGVRLVCEP